MGRVRVRDINVVRSWSSLAWWLVWSQGSISGSSLLATKQEKWCLPCAEKGIVTYSAVQYEEKKCDDRMRSVRGTPVTPSRTGVASPDTEEALAVQCFAHVRVYKVAIVPRISPY